MFHKLIAHTQFAKSTSSENKVLVQIVHVDKEDTSCKPFNYSMISLQVVKCSLAVSHFGTILALTSMLAIPCGLTLPCFSILVETSGKHDHACNKTLCNLVLHFAWGGLKGGLSPENI